MEDDPLDRKTFDEVKKRGRAETSSCLIVFEYLLTTITHTKILLDSDDAHIVDFNFGSLDNKDYIIRVLESCELFFSPMNQGEVDCRVWVEFFDQMLLSD